MTQGGVAGGGRHRPLASGRLLQCRCWSCHWRLIAVQCLNWRPSARKARLPPRPDRPMLDAASHLAITIMQAIRVASSILRAACMVLGQGELGGVVWLLALSAALRLWRLGCGCE